jgi:hypothetical protein
VNVVQHIGAGHHRLFILSERLRLEGKSQNPVPAIGPEYCLSLCLIHISNYTKTQMRELIGEVFWGIFPTFVFLVTTLFFHTVLSLLIPSPFGVRVKRRRKRNKSS